MSQVQMVKTGGKWEKCGHIPLAGFPMLSNSAGTVSCPGFDPGGLHWFHSAVTSLQPFTGEQLKTFQKLQPVWAQVLIAVICWSSLNLQGK